MFKFFETASSSEFLTQFSGQPSIARNLIRWIPVVFRIPLTRSANSNRTEHPADTVFGHFPGGLVGNRSRVRRRRSRQISMWGRLSMNMNFPDS